MTKIMTEVTFQPLLRLDVLPPVLPTPGLGRDAQDKSTDNSTVDPTTAASPTHTTTETAPRQENKATYVLYAAIVHSGQSVNSGHYYCIARPNEQAASKLRAVLRTGKDVNIDEQALLLANSDSSWHNFNDRLVSRSSFSVLADITSVFPSDVVYALWYRRVDDDEEELDAAPWSASHVSSLRARVERDNRIFSQESVAENRSAHSARPAIDRTYANFRSEDGYYDPDR